MTAKTKALYMETTEIAAEKTAAEITSLLVKSGARQVSMDYGEGGRLTGLRFAFLIDQFPITFAFPVRLEPVFRILNNRRPPGYRQQKAAGDRAQAERVAWRQLLRWAQAQFAMIDTGMVQPREEQSEPRFRTEDRIHGESVASLIGASRHRTSPLPSLRSRTLFRAPEVGQARALYRRRRPSLRRLPLRRHVAPPDTAAAGGAVRAAARSGVRPQISKQGNRIQPGSD